MSNRNEPFFRFFGLVMYYDEEIGSFILSDLKINFDKINNILPIKIKITEYDPNDFSYLGMTECGSEKLTFRVGDSIDVSNVHKILVIINDIRFLFTEKQVDLLKSI